MTLKLVRGGNNGDHVCTWCGDRFGTRELLIDHWAANPACWANHNSISAYRPAARIFGAEYPLPGQATLDLVKAHEKDDDTESSS